MDDNMQYTQIVDEKTGEIKYVPVNPPKQADSPENGEAKGKKKKQSSWQSKPGGGRDHSSPYEGTRENKYGGEDYDEIVERGDFKVDNHLTDMFRNIQANNKRLRYDKRLQSGKLDGRRLTAYKTSDRLFKKKAIKHRDYQFTIMVDLSGSMFGSKNDREPENILESKMAIALSSVVKLSHSLEDANLRVAVVGMNNAVGLVKSFNEEVNDEAILGRFRTLVTSNDDEQGEAFMAGTSEAVAYEETVKYIMANTPPKRENVVIVLSDGAPGIDYNLENTPVVFEGKFKRTPSNIMKSEYSRNTDVLYRYWERQKAVKVFGIGIMHKATQIPNAKLVNSLDDLPRVINSLVENVLM